jgi:hypothetical protein
VKECVACIHAAYLYIYIRVFMCTARPSSKVVGIVESIMMDSKELDAQWYAQCTVQYNLSSG